MRFFVIFGIVFRNSSCIFERGGVIHEAQACIKRLALASSTLSPAKNKIQVLIRVKISFLHLKQTIGEK